MESYYLSEIINSLALSNTEEKIYLLLLSSGQRSIAEIAQLIEAKISEVESGINNLISKELVFTNPGIVKKYSAIYPLVSLSEKAKESLTTIQAIGDEINAYSLEKFETLDKIVNEQKENIIKITTEAKDENRVSTETATTEITSDIEKLIDDISQILNAESRAITELASSTNIEISKHHQETTEKAGNIVSSNISDIVNKMNDAQSEITKSFEDSSAKVGTAADVMDNSLQALLENNFNSNVKVNQEIQAKLLKAIEEYNKAAKDNVNLSDQTISDNYNGIIEAVNTRLKTQDKETGQILGERIRNISASMEEMNDEFGKLIKDKLNGVRREYQQIVESFSRNIETLLTDANAQLQTMIAAKTKTNEDRLNNLFKLLEESFQKNASDTQMEIKSKENRVSTELKASAEITHRKMSEINEKLSMEITNNLNKSRTDYETAKNDMSQKISQAKDDIVNKYQEARDSTQTSIAKEFKDQEAVFTSIGSKIVDDIRELNNSSEAKTKSLIKDTEERATGAIAKIELPSKTLLNRGKQAALKVVQTQSALVNKTIDDVQTGIEDTIISETSGVKNQFKGYGDKFKESNKTIERLLAGIELTYRELITRVKDVQQPSVNTSVLLGKDSVLNQMKEILGRVKSTLTIVYPDINDVHLDELLNSNPRTRIIVISEFDPFRNAELIKQLMSKENIQLKSLAAGTTAKQYFAIGRDAEEGLVASLDDSGQVIGITSKSQAFVELISAEIINAIITPKTKRVVLPEAEDL